MSGVPFAPVSHDAALARPQEHTCSRAGPSLAFSPRICSLARTILVDERLRTAVILGATPETGWRDVPVWLCMRMEGNMFGLYPLSPCSCCGLARIHGSRAARSFSVMTVSTGQMIEHRFTPIAASLDAKAFTFVRTGRLA
jgi:hypothetical protein